MSFIADHLALRIANVSNRSADQHVDYGTQVVVVLMLGCGTALLILSASFDCSFELQSNHT